MSNMSIDTCYEDAVSKLTNQGKLLNTSKKLLALSTNHERVLYVYELLQDLKLLPELLTATKSEKVSTFYRNQGNKYYQNKDDYIAWQYYNLSLLHAPLKSDHYALALANRSAVFYSLKKYRQCLQDIEEVFCMQYPEKLKEKLTKRLTSCSEFVAKDRKSIDQNNEEEIKIISFKGPRDSRYPCASTKLEVVFNEEMGRHVIAREDIKVGEVLVEEDPYFVLLLKSQYLFSCSYCLSRNLHLLPCHGCCFTLYCSEQCRKNAWKDYHSFECSLMPTLIDMQFTKLELLALRTVLKARNDHPNWKSLFKTIEEAEKYMDSEYRGHIKVDGQWVYDSKYYASIHTLASNIEKRSVSDIFQKCVSAAVFLHFLKTHTDFMKPDNDTESDDILKYVAGTLLLHIMTSPTNMHGLSTNIQTVDGDYTEEISLASAPYAFHSLLNHSCAPNVVRYSKLGSGRMTLYALRPIKKGMQIFDNYGSHHALQDRATRQEALKFQYKFTCLCEACINDWPIYFKMQRVKNLQEPLVRQKDKILDSNALENLQKGDKGTALKLFKPLCKLIEVLDPYAPCAEWAECQESLKQCLTILKGVVPYGYSNMVQWNVVPKIN